MYSLYYISFFLASVYFPTFDCAPGRGNSLSGIPMNVFVEKNDPHFPEDLNSFADSAECKDQRDCSWITNESAKQSDGGQTLEEYCKLHRDEPSVKQCSKTCNFCKAPSPAVVCEDKRPDCKILIEKTGGGEALETYCDIWKKDKAIQQCRKTCNMCKAPSPAAVCEDERPDCKNLIERTGGGEALETYCDKWKKDKAIQQCRKTCNMCKAPSPAVVCEDERPDCKILIEKTGGGEALETYCDTWKKDKAIQQCRKTCNMCKPPSPPIEETMAPQTEQPTPETAEPTTAEPATGKPTTAAPKPNPPSGGIPSDSQKYCLEVHNKFRESHNAPPLQWSSELTRDAQEWANRLASLDQFHHDPNLQAKGQGENLYYQSPPERLCNYGESGPQCLSCEHVVGAWYNEKNDYDYTTGEAKTPYAPILHFTQIVWKATRALGMATAVGHNKLFVVARYSPAGNIIGKFQENVLPDFP